MEKLLWLANHLCKAKEMTTIAISMMVLPLLIIINCGLYCECTLGLTASAHATTELAFVDAHFTRFVEWEGTITAD